MPKASRMKSRLKRPKKGSPAGTKLHSGGLLPYNQYIIKERCTERDLAEGEHWDWQQDPQGVSCGCRRHRRHCIFIIVASSRPIRLMDPTDALGRSCCEIVVFYAERTQRFQQPFACLIFIIFYLWGPLSFCQMTILNYGLLV